MACCGRRSTAVAPLDESKSPQAKGERRASVSPISPTRTGAAEKYVDDSSRDKENVRHEATEKRPPAESTGNLNESRDEFSSLPEIDAVAKSKKGVPRTNSGRAATNLHIGGVKQVTSPSASPRTLSRNSSAGKTAEVWGGTSSDPHAVPHATHGAAGQHSRQDSASKMPDFNMDELLGSLSRVNSQDSMPVSGGPRKNFSRRESFVRHDSFARQGSQQQLLRRRDSNVRGQAPGSMGDVLEMPSSGGGASSAGTRTGRRMSMVVREDSLGNLIVDS